MLKYPDMAVGRAPTRSVGALVVLVNGALAAYLPRGGQQVVAFLPDDEPARSTAGRALAHALASIARQEQRGFLIGEINGHDPSQHPLAPYLVEAGFSPSAMGFQMRRPAAPAASIHGRA
jgi:ATP-dependent Lhr-like helicase